MQRIKLKLKPVVALVAALFVTSALAQDGVVQTENVSVFGQGQSRQVQSINSEDMKKAAAGTSPLKVLEKLPGVSFQSSDPFGAYEWSTRFGVRGFAQTYMGFTLDGIPLGDMSYGNNNGLHVSRAIASENIGRVNLSQGAGSLGVASTSNLGGTVQFYSADPENKQGMRLDQSFGSSNMSRIFARLDTGMIEGGTKAFFSYAGQKAQKWKGSGSQNQEQFNSKLVHMFGESKVSAFLNTSDRVELDYQDMSIDMQKKLGWGWDNYAPNWKGAIDAANGIFSPGVASINANTGPLDAAYYQASGLRQDRLSGAAADLALTDDVRLKTTFYTHDNKGQGHWYTPYKRSPGTAAAAGVYTGAGLPISIRTTEYSINRSGLVNDLTWNLGVNTLNAGLWYEKSYSMLTRNFYAATGPSDTNYFLSNPFLTDFVQDFVTTTTQMHLQDTVALMGGRLKVNAGFKSPKVQIKTINQSGTRAEGNIIAQNSFLPQLGFNLGLNDVSEVFASTSQNMRAYQPGVGGQFSQSQVAFNTGRDNLKPETSTNYELGYRYKGDAVQGSLAAYMTDFKDRMVSVATCAGIVGCPTTFVNVGKVQSKGLEAAVIWMPMQSWTWFNSLTMNDSQYKSNYMNGTKLVAVNGKTVVDAPKTMFNTDIGYEKNGWFGNLGGKYTDKRYYTYLNDNSVGAYTVFNAAMGYKGKNTAGFKEYTAQLTVTNLTDAKYFGTIGTNGFVESDPQGAYATLHEGAPRQLFATLSGKF